MVAETRACRCLTLLAVLSTFAIGAGCGGVKSTGGTTSGSSSGGDSSTGGDQGTESPTGITGAKTGEIELDCEPVGVDRIELPEDIVVVGDPDELLQYCGVREIEGALVLLGAESAASWDGLAALAHLEVVDGLEIRDIEESVALPSLRSVDVFLTLAQPSSVAPPLLPRLHNVGRLSVGPHDGPVDLPALESAREINVAGGDMILEALTELESFTVGSNTRSLPLAPQLERLTGAVEIEGSDLRDLALLRNVKTIEGGVHLKGLRSLQSLSDLSALESIGKAKAAGTDTFPSGGVVLQGMDALASLEGLERLAVIHGSITIERANRTPSLEGLDGVEAWRADGALGVLTGLLVYDSDDGVGLEPNQRSLLAAWLTTTELPSPCAIMVQIAPNRRTNPRMNDFDPELAALCEG